MAKKTKSVMSGLPKEMQQAIARFQLTMDGLNNRAWDTLESLAPKDQPTGDGVSVEDQQAFWEGMLLLCEYKPEKIMHKILTVALGQLEEDINKIDAEEGLPALPPSAFGSRRAEA